MEMESRGCEEVANLPEEVINKEILTRLPVKSLLKFRCVSKSWCSLIGSKSFIKQHLKHSISISAQHLIFFNEDEQEAKQCSLPSLFDRSFTEPVTSYCSAGSESGSCNGLSFVLEKDDRFILWNPSTKMFKYLPSLLDEIQVNYIHVAHGLGFDELNDDYKVYGMVYQVDEDKNPIRCISKIYSLKSNSWEVIEERDVSQFDIPFDNQVGMGKYVNGKLHWYETESYKRDIVSFDLNSNVYGVVELPSFINGFLDSLEVVGGCLSMQCYQPNGDTDVWLMREYGVKESWDKVATVPCHLDFYKIPTALAIGSNGEVLLAYPSTLMIYDPKSDVFRHPHINGIDDDIKILYLGIYTESLASVDPDTEQKR